MYQDVSIEEYQSRFANNGTINSVLLDVREVNEFAQGHIPGAVNLPLSELQMRLNELDNDLPIVIVCQTGVRSVMAAKFMVVNGYSDVYNLLEGTHGWMVRRLQLER